jgi:branched-chain amino acid aminotransferase
MPGLYLFNGTYFSADQPALFPDNRGYRYGDGLFETLRVCNGRIPLWDLHVSRLFRGLAALGILIPKHLTASVLLERSLDVCRRNKLNHARLRITVNRGEGGILEPVSPVPDICIQAWPLDEAIPRFNPNGLRLGFYRHAAKSPDSLSNLKSSSYLLYAMAALYAKEQAWNDALVLNTRGQIADTSIANLCWAKSGRLFTIPLADGPVDGVMLQWLKSRLDLHEVSASPDSLTDADAVFITNAVRGVQWVSHIEDAVFADASIAHTLYRDHIVPVFS